MPEKRLLPPGKARKTDKGHHLLITDIYQAAKINVKMPAGFRLCQEQEILKAMQQRKNAKPKKKKPAKLSKAAAAAANAAAKQAELEA